jgi:transcriptional regulator with XRE-family HTH domain
VKGKPRNIVGPQVRRRRYELGLSQNEFAARCQVRGWDVTRDTICDIELQRRWVADFELVNLARHLQVPVDSLWPASVRRKLQLTPARP